MKVAVSFLSSDNYEDGIKKINESSADLIHADYMDGIFVDNQTFTIPELKKWIKGVNKPVDIHLMATSPNKYIRDLVKIPEINTIIIHAESHRHPIDVINMINHTGKKSGIAINPETKVVHIIPYLKKLDKVLIMSVKPGAGGQTFMKDVLYKVATLLDIKKEGGYHFTISIDGGVNDETIKLCQEAKLDEIVSGSYVMKSSSIEDAIKKLR